MSKEIKLNLPPVDDLFSTQESRDDAKREKVMDVSLSEIDDFPNHPFQVKDDDAMRNMVESVQKFGILTPAVARQKEDGRYELISGHRRKRACDLACIDTLPVIIRQMSRDEAIIFMVDSNLQREVILPSEKAFSYRMKLEAMKRRAGRPSKDNSVPVAQNFDGKTSRQLLGEQIGESQDQIRRYIRLTELIPEILQMVDDNKMAFRPAVEISYLPKKEQQSLFDTMECEDCTPSLAQAIKMKQFSQEGRLNDDVILSILSEEKPNQKEQFKIPKERINKYFPVGTPTQKIEDTIIKALELYRKRQRDRER